jgi:hypothetical protein
MHFGAGEPLIERAGGRYDARFSERVNIGWRVGGTLFCLSTEGIASSLFFSLFRVAGRDERGHVIRW